MWNRLPEVNMNSKIWVIGKRWCSKRLSSVCRLNSRSNFFFFFFFQSKCLTFVRVVTPMIHQIYIYMYILHVYWWWKPVTFSAPLEIYTNLFNGRRQPMKPHSELLSLPLLWTSCVPSRHESYVPLRQARILSCEFCVIQSASLWRHNQTRGRIPQLPLARRPAMLGRTSR